MSNSGSLTLSLLGDDTAGKKRYRSKKAIEWPGYLDELKIPFFTLKRQIPQKFNNGLFYWQCPGMV